MVIICVLGSYVDGFYDYSQAKPSRCSTIHIKGVNHNAKREK